MSKINLKPDIIIHFHNLGYEIEIDQSSVVWKAGGPIPRLAALLRYYFGDVDHLDYGEFIVSINKFNPEGHGSEDICKYCGCTHDDACMDGHGRICYWFAPNVCSNCKSKV